MSSISFRWSGDLKGHLRTHSVEKPFKCKVCQASLINSGMLKKCLGLHRTIWMWVISDRPQVVWSFQETFKNPQCRETIGVQSMSNKLAVKKKLWCAIYVRQALVGLRVWRAIREPTVGETFEMWSMSGKLSQSGTLKSQQWWKLNIEEYFDGF